jgi:methionine aminopeptidase
MTCGMEDGMPELIAVSVDVGANVNDGGTDVCTTMDVGMLTVVSVPVAVGAIETGAVVVVEDGNVGAGVDITESGPVGVVVAVAVDSVAESVLNVAIGPT